MIGFLATSPFLALCALACPLSMGAMMWFMVRGTRSNSSRAPAEQPSTVADLRRKLENLEGEYAEASHAAAESVPLTASPARVTMAGARDTLAR
jgi:hypothetical protein